MSIIQEALKKAQVSVGAGAPKEPAREPKAGQPQQPPAKAAHAVKPGIFPKTVVIAATVVLIAAIAVVALFVGSLVSTRPGQDAASALPAPPAQEVRLRELPKAEADAVSGGAAQDAARLNAELASTAPKLVLNGIMYLEEGPRAIVNNAMVEVGDFVSGAKVVRIDRKNVVLVYNDVEITLTLK